VKGREGGRGRWEEGRGNAGGREGREGRGERRAEEKMTRVILRSIRLSLITSNYSCGSVLYVLITSRNEAGDL